MTLIFVGVVLLDGWVDGSLIAPETAILPIQASIFCLLIVLLIIPAQREMARLISKTGAHIFRPIVIVASILLATGWYWRQFYSDEAAFHLYYILFVSVWSLFSVLLHQGLRFGPKNAIINCSASFFMISYLGLLAGFVLGLRIDFGPWVLLMFIFTVKSSDIGAYTVGRLLGKHKFSPEISPGKTWEGLAGGVIFGSIVAYLFSRFCGIMGILPAVIFGAIFAVLGQLGDLAESMIKRDAEVKDSAQTVPGFGGILDVIDSPLATAPLAYLFFMLILG